MLKPPAIRSQSSADRTAGQAARRVQLWDAERRAHQARARMNARAAECEDPSLQMLLQRLATASNGGTAKIAQLKRGKGASLRDGAMPPDEAAATIDASPHDGSAQHGSTSNGSAKHGSPQKGTEPVLRQRIDVTGNLLILKTERPEGFEYRAGQHTRFGVPGTLRTYSIVSAPHEPQLEFFIELIPGGRLSTLLRTLAAGESVAVGDRAKGDLGLDESRRNHLMLATVTGIAPFISILRGHFFHARTGHRFIVLTGASYADELAYRAELDAMASEHPDALVHIPAVSRPGEPRNTGWTGATGRLNGLAAALPDEHGLTPADTAIYACGHPAMVAVVAGHFRERGYPVHTEPYD